MRLTRSSVELRARYLQDLLHRGHAELQRAVVHEAENVAEPSSRQPLHVDLVLVPLPHVCREHDPEVVALGGQQRLVGLKVGGANQTGSKTKPSSFKRSIV